MVNRKDLYENIKMDYPNLPDDMVYLLIDTYNKDKEWLDSKIKDEKRKNKYTCPPKPKTQLTLSDIETLNEKMKNIPEGKGWVEDAPQEINSEIIVNECIPEA